MSDAPSLGRPRALPSNGPPGHALGVVAVTLGVVAALLGFEHGYFEWLQTGAAPDGLVIEAIGPPCRSATAWHACEPAFTVIPDYHLTGALAMLVALVVLVWAAAFVRRPHGGPILLLLVGLLWLVGGGFVTLIIGLTAGIAATLRDSSLAWWQAHLGPTSRRALAAAWPGVLLAFLALEAVSWMIGSLANDVMLVITPLTTALSLLILVLIVLAAVASDLRPGTRGPRPV